MRKAFLNIWANTILISNITKPPWQRECQCSLAPGWWGQSAPAIHNCFFDWPSLRWWWGCPFLLKNTSWTPTKEASTVAGGTRWRGRSASPRGKESPSGPRSFTLKSSKEESVWFSSGTTRSRVSPKTGNKVRVWAEVRALARWAQSSSPGTTWWNVTIAKRKILRKRNRVNI